MQLSNSFFRIFIFLLLTIISSNSFSQTVVWKEDFNATPCNSLCLANSYSGTNGNWSVTIAGAEGATPNRWYVSCAENGNAVGACGSGCAGGGNNTLHICNDPNSPAAAFFCVSGDCGALFDSGLGDGSVVTDKRAESPTINLTGKSNLTLTFQYMEGGSAQDNLTVEYFNGSSWTSLSDPGKTATCGGGHPGKWTTYSIALPSSADNNANVKIGLRWKNNDDAAGSDPSTAIDDVTITTGGASTVTSEFSGDKTTICKGDCVTFTDLSTPSGTITTWAWTFTGGVVSGGTQNTYIGKTPPKVCYPNAGTFDVQLFVSDGNNQNTLKKTAYITVQNCAQVAANFEADSTSICGKCVKFTDKSTPSGKITSWFWSFPGGSPASSSLQNPPTICYSATGTYNVSLYVSDGSSSHTLSQPAYITVKNCNTKPTAKFSASSLTACQNVGINFTDNSTDNPTSWNWSFPGGSPASSSQQNPSNIKYSTPGTYKVTLTATNTYGNDTESVKITITDCPKPTPQFSLPKNQLCYRECVDFTNTSLNADYYSWTILGPHKVGDSISLAKISPSNICFDSTGDYVIILTAFNSQGDSSYSLIVSVDTCPSLPSAFSPNGDGKNDVFHYTGNTVDKVLITIYNRWGKLVFETNNKTIGWNGRFKNTGEPQEVGVYVYYLEATMTDGTIMKKKGNITLLR